MLLWHIDRGDSPLIVNVPHAGRHVPDAIALRLSARARDVPDTDWHVDELYRFAPSTGATLLAATHSRYVVDLNRDPSGKALYPGADNTELCPTRTFCNEPVYRRARRRRRRRSMRDARRTSIPITRCSRARSTACAIGTVTRCSLDGHSIAAEVPRFFAGRLPDLNLGTGDGASCDAAAQALAAGIVSSAAGFTHVVNGRFKGGFITRHYGAPDGNVHALQLEMTQACYMDEANPVRYDATRAAAVIAVLERLLVALAEWRPAVRAQ